MNAFLNGVTTVALQEFRLRIRKGRWHWLLSTWFAILFAFTFLMWLALEGSYHQGKLGTPLYGGLMLLVLALALLVVPSLTATSINGDRERGTLATLQVTLLSPLQITLGKFFAAWGTVLVFLALSIPMVLWCMIQGGAPPIRALTAFVVLALLLGTVCAVSQAFSALFARSTTSSVVSYISIFMGTVATFIVFGLIVSVTATVHETEVKSRYGNYTHTEKTAHPEDYWWIIAPNPYIVLADSAPALPLVLNKYTGRPESQPGDVLGGIRNFARTTRAENFGEDDADYDPSSDGRTRNETKEPGPLWPFGLVMNVALGVGALTLTTRKLRTPTYRLGRGVRVA